MSKDARVRVMYCEGNMDGTIGGSYYSLLFLIQALDRSRFAPIIVFRRAHGLQPRFARVAESVHVLAPATPFRFAETAGATPLRPMMRVLQRAMNFGLFILSVLKQSRFLRQQQIDIVHLNNSVTRNHDWMLAAMLTRTPCLTHERGINERFPTMARRLAPRLSGILCISEAVKENLLSHRVASENLHVIPNALDVSEVVTHESAAFVRAQYGIGADQRVIGMVGNIKSWKGQEVLVRALPAIQKQVPDLLCLFVGDTAEEDRRYGDRLRSLIDELGMTRHVTFTGFRQHVADVLQVMEVAIHASTAPEPFGRVLLEAMALRKPVVGSRGGAVPEIVIDGVTGYTFEPGNADALARRVVELLADPARGRAFGEAGRHRVTTTFHISQNADATTQIYAMLARHAGAVGTFTSVRTGTP